MFLCFCFLPLRNIRIPDFCFAPGPQILSFILIRNIPGCVRSAYSSFFAWFGKISLEVSWTPSDSSLFPSS